MPPARLEASKAAKILWLAQVGLAAFGNSPMFELPPLGSSMTIAIER